MISGLMNSISPSPTSTTIIRRAMPTWGAAKPMPSASYMVSAMSRRMRPKRVSNLVMGLAFTRSSFAPMVKIFFLDMVPPGETVSGKVGGIDFQADLAGPRLLGQVVEEGEHLLTFLVFKNFHQHLGAGMAHDALDGRLILPDKQYAPL